MLDVVARGLGALRCLRLRDPVGVRVGELPGRERLAACLQDVADAPDGGLQGRLDVGRGRLLGLVVHGGSVSRPTGRAACRR